MVNRMTTPTRKPAVTQDPKAWALGYLAGLEGSTKTPPPGMDGLAWVSGKIEGQADRSKPPEQRRNPFQRRPMPT